MAKFTLNGYDSYAGVDIVVTARINNLSNTTNNLKEKVYTLGSLQTLSISTHQEKRAVRVIGSVNSLDYVMGQRTVAGSLVFAVFDKHFATEMFNDLKEATGKTFKMVDELPGLDLTITFANEYGKKSRMAIYGVKIINEGQVMSINDLFTENTYQFVATSLDYLKTDISSGSSEETNGKQQITSSKVVNVSKNQSSKGEDIYKKVSSSNLLVNNVNLAVSVEQPTSYKQDGIAIFDLSPKQKSGYINVYDKKNDKTIVDIEVRQGAKRYSVYLPAGQYKAWYYRDNQKLSNIVHFTINQISKNKSNINDTPVIENVTHKSIKAMSNNISHDKGICIDLSDSKKMTTNINSRNFQFDSLEPSKTYMLYTTNGNETSKAAITKTLDFNNMNLNLFKEYVKNNRNLLSKDYSNYKPLLEKLKDENFLYTLMQDKSIEAKELIYMAVKYSNEFTTIINEKHDTMPVKKDDSIYGNNFKFNTSVSKANIFLNKNRKDYFENSEAYPNEINYIGKSNNLYNVVGINNDFIKSPKYLFYSYSDNDKNLIKQQFGDINVLNELELKPNINKLSEDSLKCLTAKSYKQKDIDLLKAPKGYINENCDLIVDLDYRNILGDQNTIYYLCVSKLHECLDKTPFRKVKTYLNNSNVIINKISTAINKDDVYAIWIENEDYNTISDLGFVSYSDKIENLSYTIIKEKITSIIRKLEVVLNKNGSLSDIISMLNYDDINEKDIYIELAKTFINYKESISFDLLFELFKIQFAEMCINKDKYKKVTYNTKNKSIIFDAEKVSMVQLKLSKNGAISEIIDGNEAINDITCDYTLFYLISQNPVIKSGFVLINNSTNQAISYYIDLEVI